MPSVTPTSITCGHSSPLEACRVDSVTTFWSCSRSLMVESSATFCAISSTLRISLCVVTPAVSSMVPPQRCAIQSQNSSTLVQRAAAIFSLSSLSYRYFSKWMSLSQLARNSLAASAPVVDLARNSRSFR